MQTKKCSSCGATLQILDKICKYCNTSIYSEKEFSPELKDKLTTFILSMDKLLQNNKSKFDHKNGITFALLSLLFFISSYFIYQSLSWISAFLTIITWGVCLFVIFGAFVVKWENAAMKIVFDSTIRSEINKFLLENGISEINFKITTVEVLPENSALRIFVNEL